MKKTAVEMIEEKFFGLETKEFISWFLLNVEKLKKTEKENAELFAKFNILYHNYDLEMIGFDYFIKL